MKRARSKAAFVTGRPRKAIDRRADHAAYVASWAKPYMEIRQADGAEFFRLRRHMLGLSRADVARLLRVAKNTVWDWERGRRRLPFSAYFALRLIAESLRFRLASEAWRDWQLEDGHQMTGRGKIREATWLRNVKTGACFEPKDLDSFFDLAQMTRLLVGKEHDLTERINALTAENRELRDLFQAQGVTVELQQMRDRLQQLHDRVNTAQILPLPSRAAA